MTTQEKIEILRVIMPYITNFGTSGVLMDNASFEKVKQLFQTISESLLEEFPKQKVIIKNVRVGHVVDATDLAFESEEPIFLKVYQ